MKGYKAFDKDLKCKGFQYEIGQTYEIDGEIECCKKGFHFCRSLSDCYGFYETSDNTRICEVEALGEIKTNDAIKYCTNKIKILSEVENPRIKSNINKTSSGYCNTGSYNSGNYNTGDGNIGNMNCGDINSGYCNSGDCNVGNFNTGDFNSGNHNVGIFNCHKDPKIRIFDKESDWTMKDWYESEAYKVMIEYPYYTFEYDSEHEKTIVQAATAEDRQEWWNELSEDDKNAVKSLPNFDTDKFYLCTGIKV